MYVSIKNGTFRKTTLDLFLDVTNWYVAKNPAIPEYTFKRNASAFETTDGLPVKADGSNAIPTRVKNDDPFVTPTIGFIIEFLKQYLMRRKCSFPNYRNNK